MLSKMKKNLTNFGRCIKQKLAKTHNHTCLQSQHFIRRIKIIWRGIKSFAIFASMLVTGISSWKLKELNWCYIHSSDLQRLFKKFQAPPRKRNHSWIYFLGKTLSGLIKLEKLIQICFNFYAGEVRPIQKWKMCDKSKIWVEIRSFWTTLVTSSYYYLFWSMAQFLHLQHFNNYE